MGLRDSWVEVPAAYNNLGEDDGRIFAKEINKTLAVAYHAYGSIKVAIFTGVEDLSEPNEYIVDYCEEQDGEMAIGVVDKSGTTVLLSIDSCDYCATDTNTDIELISTYEFDIDELACSEYADLIDVFELM